MHPLVENRVLSYARSPPASSAPDEMALALPMVGWWGS